MGEPSKRGGWGCGLWIGWFAFKNHIPREENSPPQERGWSRRPRPGDPGLSSRQECDVFSLGLQGRC